MKLKEYAQALRDLYEKVNLSDRIESLKLYSAIHVIADGLDEVIQAEGKQELPHGGIYVREKLELFVTYLNYAVMPVESADQTPLQWYKSAGDNLMKVEISIPK